MAALRSALDNALISLREAETNEWRARGKLALAEQNLKFGREAVAGLRAALQEAGVDPDEKPVYDSMQSCVAVKTTTVPC